ASQGNAKRRKTTDDDYLPSEDSSDDDLEHSDLELSPEDEENVRAHWTSAGGTRLGTPADNDALEELDEQHYESEDEDGEITVKREGSPEISWRNVRGMR
ncbi:MAG: hypothetical protein Q9198_002740, partial [Flavoplaca austrocitrina]